MFNAWSKHEDGTTFVGSPGFASRLPAGLYTCSRSNYNEPVCGKIDVASDDIYHFNGGPTVSMLAELAEFWRSKERYAKLGVAHKRGYLMYGPAGCGKSAILRRIIESVVAADGLVYQITDLERFNRGFALSRQIEKGRPTVLLVEDLDNMVSYAEAELLEVLDGVSSLGDGVVFIATTNHLSQIPPRVRARPSRIDTLVHIGFPETPQRYEYARFLLGKMGGASEGVARAIADATADLSLADIKEVVIGSVVYGRSAGDVAEKIRKNREAVDPTEQTEDDDDD